MSRPVALITGATSGIGRAIAEQLSSTHHLLIGGRDSTRLSDTLGALESAEPFAVELTDAAAVAQACAGIEHLDVLVHSAGVASLGPIAEASAEEWQRVLSVNVTAAAVLTAALLPALRASAGTVVFINSGAGLHASPQWGVYAASKFALTALADALRAEESGRVRVISAHPGRVATPMQAEINAWEGRPYRAEHYLSPTDVATAVVSAIRLPQQATVTTLRITPSSSSPPRPIAIGGGAPTSHDTATNPDGCGSGHE